MRTTIVLFSALFLLSLPAIEGREITDDGGETPRLVDLTAPGEPASSKKIPPNAIPAAPPPEALSKPPAGLTPFEEKDPAATPPAPLEQENPEKMKEQARRIREKLEIALNRLLKKPRSLQIDLFNTTDQDLLVGKIPRMAVEIRDARFDGLNIKQARFLFKEGQVVLEKLLDLEIFEIPRLDAVDLDAVLTETDLNTFVQHKVKEVRDPRIELNEGQIILSGRSKLGGILMVKFRAAGVFEVRQGSEIHFLANSLKVSGLPVPFARKALSRINPVLRMDKFPFKILLKGIALKNGFIHFYSDEDPSHQAKFLADLEPDEVEKLENSSSQEAGVLEHSTVPKSGTEPASPEKSQVESRKDGFLDRHQRDRSRRR